MGKLIEEKVVLIRILLILLACLTMQSCASTAQAEQLGLAKRNFADGDYKQSFHALLPLASEGNARAQYAVGYMYYYGYGVARDAESGIFWMHKAAAQHYEPAIKALQILQS